MYKLIIGIAIVAAIAIVIIVVVAKRSSDAIDTVDDISGYCPCSLAAGSVVEASSYQPQPAMQRQMISRMSPGGKSRTLTRLDYYDSGYDTGSSRNWSGLQSNAIPMREREVGPYPNTSTYVRPDIDKPVVLETGY